MADNAKYALSWLTKQGYTPDQAAGIVGNLMQESGVDPTISPGDNGQSFGIAQWNGDRLSALKDYANQNGTSFKDLDTQLGFLNNELNGSESKAGDAIRSSQDVPSATAAAAGYERPSGYTPDNPEGANSYDKRLAYASQLSGQAQPSALDKVASSIGNFLMPSANAAEADPTQATNISQLFGSNVQIPQQSSTQDFSNLTDEQLQKIADGGTQQDFSHLTDDQLQNIVDGGKASFTSRMGTDLGGRADNATAAANAYLTHLQTLGGSDQGQGLGQTALQMVGNLGYGPANDLIGNAAISGYHALPNSVQNYIGDKASALKDYVANTDIGKGALNLLGDVKGAASDFAQQNPNAARSLGAVNDIASFAPMMEGASAVTGPVGKGLESAGSAIENVAANQASEAKDKFVQNLILPKETPKILEDQVGRTTENKFGTKVYDPTPEEKEIAGVVSDIPEVKSSNTINANFNAVQSALGAEANNLKTDLIRNDVVFPRKEFNAQLNQVVQNLTDNPLLTGDAAATAQKIVDQMKKFVLNNKASASGLLQARKDLDKWIKTQKGGAAFDPVKENAISTALREVRQTTNGFIAQKVPSVGVADSLRKQNLMYKAMDNMAPKAAAEAKTSIGRVSNRISNAIPGKGVIGKMGAVLGGSALGGAVASAVPALATAGLVGAGLYGAGKAATSATGIKIIGKSLSTAGKAAKAVTAK